MVSEEMLELVNLSLILGTTDENTIEITHGIMETVDGSIVDTNKMLKRYKELLKEFVNPYVIDNNSKE